MKCSPSFFPRGATWMRICGRIRFKLWLSAWRETQAVLWKTMYFIKYTSEGERGREGMTPLAYYTQHRCHLRQFITRNFPSSWPLAPLYDCICIEGSVPLSELSVWSLPGGTQHCLRCRNMLLKPFLVAFCRTCVPFLCADVYHCPRSSPVFHACCLLDRQWPLTRKYHSGQYVSKACGMERRSKKRGGGWSQRKPRWM